MICKICNNSLNNRALEVREMMFGLGEVFTYFECANCGCLQIAEIPRDMARYYASGYQPHQQRVPDNVIARLLKISRDRYMVFHKGLLGRLVQSIFPNEVLPLLARTGITPQSRILDVGCGTGVLLLALRDLGFTHLTGIDPYVGEEAASGPVRILRKTVYDLPQDARFDLIVANHSLEHMEDQSGALVSFREMLDKDGVCLIRIPVKTDPIWKTYGVDWVQIDAPRHFFLHTLDGFVALIKKTGFSVVEVLFDSTEFQFWGSEQYRKNIPLLAENSYLVDRHKSMFTRGQIASFRRKARELNSAGQGDQAAFFLKRAGST